MSRPAPGENVFFTCNFKMLKIKLKLSSLPGTFLYWSIFFFCTCTMLILMMYSAPFLLGPVRLPAMPTRDHDYAHKIQHLAVMTDNSMYRQVTQGGGLLYQGRNICDAKGQAWRRNPSGKPTNEERARTAGLFQSQDCWKRDRDHWLLLSTPLHPPATEPWVASKLTPGQGKGGREGGEVSPG